MRVAMIGTGYVGLVSGTCFSEFGHTVICVDKNPDRIEALQRGEIPIFEPGLDDLVARNVKAGRLSFTQDTRAAVESADAVRSEEHTSELQSLMRISYAVFC